MNQPGNAPDTGAETANEPDAQVDASQAAADGRPDGAAPAADAEALGQAQAEITQLKDQLLRAHAEMENVRRRAMRDVDQARKFGAEKLANEMLPLKESLDRGIEATAADGATVASLREGLELTQRQFMSAFEKIGIEELDPVGEPFNPEFHEAMVMQPSADAEPNTVLQVIQRGYTLNGRLMRPARVIVAAAAS